MISRFHWFMYVFGAILIFTAPFDPFIVYTSNIFAILRLREESIRRWLLALLFRFTHGPRFTRLLRSIAHPSYLRALGTFHGA